MIERDGFFSIPLLPAEMREQKQRLPEDKSEWPKRFLEEYRRLHAAFTAGKGTFVAWARKDRDPRMTRTAKLVLAYLVDCLNFNTGRCDPSQRTIADEIGVSVRTVERAIKQVMEAGWMDVSRRGKTVTNFYRFRVPKAKIDALIGAADVLRQLRIEARNTRLSLNSDPSPMSDHPASDPTPVTAHDPTSMTVRDPTPVTGKPMKRTFEDEPLNEKVTSVEKVMEDTGGDPFLPYDRHVSPNEGRFFLTELGVARSDMDDCLRRLLGGNLTPYDIEMTRQKRGAA
ncbi:helix-turn-helix domain-containing protein [Pararhizobium gei]|uniref:helix-turn-helix domain-containing protein n=1 Tax=Pararhizobium gei TaxID=1395951 RepID=UPI0023DB8ADF|nr:helix-turn-helix domain-containing protein [Rhizobium gei]